MILAIDPSSSRTGWCKGPAGGPVSTGSLSLGQFGDEYGPMLRTLDDWLRCALDGVDIVFYEEPINSKFQSLASRRKLYPLGAFIEWRCFKAGVRVREIGNTTCKKVGYGRGNITTAEKREHAVRLANAWGFAPDNDDEADACAVFLAGIKEWFPEAFLTWTERKAAGARETGGLLL